MVLELLYSDGLFDVLVVLVGGGGLVSGIVWVL